MNHDTNILINDSNLIQRTFYAIQRLCIINFKICTYISYILIKLNITQESLKSIFVSYK